ncbi:MAG: DUF4259 domain-containing protein [Verrucomicrobiae bacterium]|nr:DUF4259 domain-containing protein [Verrucomicrobiae bacterium]
MGTWSIKPFGNDAALDWLDTLDKSNNPTEFISNAILRSQDESDDKEAIAAAAIIASASFDPVGGITKDAKSWIEKTGYVPTKELIASTVIRLKDILAHSELKELWEESGSIKSWTKDTLKIVERLDTVQQSILPQRVPKRKGLPRLLYKLVELYSSNPDPSLEAMIRKKVEAISDPNKPTKETNHELPLTLLSKSGMFDMVRYLLKKGANPNISSGLYGSPLVHACSRGHVQVAEELISHGAELFQEITIDKTTGHTMDIVLDKESAQPIPFRFSQALYAAARSGTPETIDFLLSKGCDINQCDLNGETLLHKAAENGNVDTLWHLIKVGVSVDKGKSGSNEPPIHYSVRARQYEATKALIESGANVNALDSFRGEEHSWDISPLDIAIDNNDKKIIELLSTSGAIPGDEIAGRKK